MSSIAERLARERSLVNAKRLRYSVPFAQYYHRWYNDVLLALLRPDSSLRVLDCGCGTGVLLPALRRRYRIAIGIDFCIENLIEARGANGAAALAAGDIESLPCAPLSVDQIVCRGVLYRLPDTARAFEQLFSALAAGGDLVISEPIGDSRLLAALRAAAHAARIHPLPGPPPVTYPTAQQWIDTAEAAGFRTLRWFHLGYVAFPLLGFPEAIPVMRYAPYSMAIAKLLLRLDRALVAAPYLKASSWHAVFHFRKPSDSVLEAAASSGSTLTRASAPS